MSAVTQSSLKHYKVKIRGLEIFKKRTSNRKGGVGRKKWIWGGWGKGRSEYNQNTLNEMLKELIKLF